MDVATRSIVAWLIIISFVLTAVGREPAGMSLDDCVRVAFDRSRRLARARADIERAQFQRARAEDEAFAPKLTSRYLNTQDGEEQTGEAGVSFAAPWGMDVEPFVAVDRRGSINEPFYQSSIGLHISRPLFAIHEELRRRLPVRRADGDIQEAVNEVALIGRELRLEVTLAYLAVAYAKRREAVVRQSLPRVEGNSHATDYLNRSLLLVELFMARCQREVGRDRLRRAMGLGPFEPVKLRLPATLASDVMLPSPENDLAKLLVTHETLLDLRRRIDLLEQRIAVQEDEVRPKIDLRLTVEEEGATHDPFAPPRHSDFRVELTYTLPFDFKRGARRKLEQLRQQLVETRGRLLAAEIDLRVRLEENRREIERLRQRIAEAEARTVGEPSSGATAGADLEGSPRLPDELSRRLDLVRARAMLLEAHARRRALLPQ